MKLHLLTKRVLILRSKITKDVVEYPKGFEPKIFKPTKYNRNHRFIIGKDGSNPLVALCMNPSAARDEKSDRTVNRIIAISRELNKDGWFVINLYPERATKAKDIKPFKQELCKRNICEVEDFLKEYNISEVWGAWGNDQNVQALIQGREEMLKMLHRNNIRIFYFGTLTAKGNPRHPLQRNEKWDLKKLPETYDSQKQ